MKLISWNVNGLRACVKKDFMASLRRPGRGHLLRAGDQAPAPRRADRTWTCRGTISSWNSAEKKGYSGVAIFTKRRAALGVTYGLGIEEHDHEGRVITAEF